MSKTYRTDCLLIQSPFSAQGILPHSDAHTIGEGIVSIGTFLDDKGFSTRIFCVDELYLDVKDLKFDRKKYSFSHDRMKAVIAESAPRIVAISALTPQYPAALEILKLCKDIDPDIVTAIGGPHVTFTDKQVFKDSSYVDIVVRGEGEWTMAELVGNILGEKPLEGVKGITFKDGDEIISNEDRPLQDISTLPPVNYAKVNRKYLEKCKFFLTFTRGCPFNCSYCVEGKFWGNNVRTRNIDALRNEIEYITKNFNAGEIFFLGSVFNFPEDFFKKICAYLKESGVTSSNVSVLVGAAYLPEEHIMLMKEAGIRKLLIAMESAAPSVLKRMNKNITFELLVEKCRLIKKHGMEVGTFWLFGHPGETEETARMSLDAMTYMWKEGLNDKQEVAVFTPYPGIPILNDTENVDFELVNNNISQYSRFDNPVIKLKSLSYEKLCMIYNEARQICQYWSSFNRVVSEGMIGDTLENIVDKALQKKSVG